MRAARRRGLAAVLLAALALAACDRAPVPKPEEIRPVRVIEVGAEARRDTVGFAGEVRARHETRLAFRVPGKMTGRLVEVGSRVQPGQPVAQLDATDLRLAAEAARAQVATLESERALVEADLRRFRELREKNFISAAEFERRATALATTEARLEAARAQSRQAQNQAGYATLFADSAGVVVGLDAEAGQVLAAGQTVARIARAGEREVLIAVPETQREFVARAVRFTVTLNALPGRQWQGRLRELAPLADPATRTYAARIRVLEAGEAIELGMSAHVSVAGGEAPARIELPIAALATRGESPSVMVLADGAVQPRAVKTGGIDGERVIILDGLTAGERVVAAGAALLKPGQKVKVLDTR